MTNQRGLTFGDKSFEVTTSEFANDPASPRKEGAGF